MFIRNNALNNHLEDRLQKQKSRASLKNNIYVIAFWFLKKLGFLSPFILKIILSKKTRTVEHHFDQIIFYSQKENENSTLKLLSSESNTLFFEVPDLRLGKLLKQVSMRDAMFMLMVSIVFIASRCNRPKHALNYTKYLLGFVIGLKTVKQNLSLRIVCFPKTRNPFFYGIADGIEYYEKRVRFYFVQKYVAEKSQTPFFCSKDHLITSSLANGRLYQKLNDKIIVTNALYLEDSIKLISRGVPSKNKSGLKKLFWVGQESIAEDEYKIIKNFLLQNKLFSDEYQLYYLTRKPDALNNKLKKKMSSLGLIVIQTSNARHMMPNLVFGGFSNLLCAFSLIDIPTFHFLSRMEINRDKKEILKNHMKAYSVQDISELRLNKTHGAKKQKTFEALLEQQKAEKTRLESCLNA